MADKPRTAKIIVSLVSAMTIAAIVLILLDGDSISAGPFSLSSYASLESVEDIVGRVNEIKPGRWNMIEVFYSRTAAGNPRQLASIYGLTSPQDLNFHFLVCNSNGAVDGQIFAMEKWLRQWSCISGGSWYGSAQTIRVCVVGEENNNVSSDCQITRTHVLVEELSRRLAIPASRIHYPAGWQY